MWKFFVIFILAFAASFASAAELVRTFEYGRFTVEVSEDGGQTVRGGVFTPVATLPLQDAARWKHAIFVDYSTKELTYYRLTVDGSYEPVVGYAVMTPDPDFLPEDVVIGFVRKIDTKPTWCPGPQARRIYPDLPEGCLPFGHKDNAMGVAKFEVIWHVQREQKRAWSAIRLHGTEGYAEGEFWLEDSLGCVRLLDSAMLELLQYLGPEIVEDTANGGVQIFLMRGTQDSSLFENRLHARTEG